MMHKRGLLARGLPIIGAAALLLTGVMQSSGAAQADASWQTSAPRQAIGSDTPAQLGLRNKFGSDGECYQFTVQVVNPFEQPASAKSDWVCGSDWTYEQYLSTDIVGLYTVYYSI